MCFQIFSNDFSKQDQLKQHAVQGQAVCVRGKLSQRKIVPVDQETLLVGSIKLFFFGVDMNSHLNLCQSGTKCLPWITKSGSQGSSYCQYENPLSENAFCDVSLSKKVLW